MKKCMLFLALGLVGTAALAQETGRVISSVPVIQQVAVPRQVCGQQQVITQQPQSSGGGALVGAIVGGLLGHTIGNGSGRVAATGIGVIAGAAVGDSVENRGNAPIASTQPVCTTQVFHENRTVGYDVTYEYAGTQHQVRMPYDPGPTVRLQVVPVGASEPQPVRPQPQSMTGGATMTYVPPVIEQSVTVLPSVAYAPAVYYRPYPSYYHYPVGVSLNFGYWGGHRHGHRHWRHRHWR